MNNHNRAASVIDLRAPSSTAPASPQNTTQSDSPMAVRAQTPSMSCVVPCHNEAVNLSMLLPALAATLGRLTGHWEIILVDDGSTDDTPDLLHGWAQLPGVRTLQLSRNFGKEAALSAGLAAAHGDVVLMLDADFQHPLALIDDMLRTWREGADVVYAVRANRDDESQLKRLGAGLFYRLLNAQRRFHVPEGAGDFRLMDRCVVEALLALPERNRFMKGLYAWVGFRAVPLSYVPPPRANGASHYGLLQLAKLSLDGLTSFTTWPLRAVSTLGILLAITGFIYASWLCLTYFIYGHPVSGWTTIVVGLMMFSGVQMLSLGIVGEYVGRIFEEVKGRPLYVIRQEGGHGLPSRR